MSLQHSGEEDLYHLYYHRYLIATSAAAVELIYYKLLPLRLLSYVSDEEDSQGFYKADASRETNQSLNQPGIYLSRNML